MCQRSSWSERGRNLWWFDWVDRRRKRTNRVIRVWRRTQLRAIHVRREEGRSWLYGYHQSQPQPQRMAVWAGIMSFSHRTPSVTELGLWSNICVVAVDKLNVDSYHSSNMIEILLETRLQNITWVKELLFKVPKSKNAKVWRFNCQIFH